MEFSASVGFIHKEYVKDLYSSLEGQREWESDRETSKTPDYANYDMGTALREWANRNKVFKNLTVDSIREW